MDDFCAIKPRLEKALRPEWESHLLEGFWLARTQSEVNAANQQWRHAVSLKEEQGDAAAVAYCRDCLARELVRWPRGPRNPCESFLVRCCVVQLVRLWAADILKRKEAERFDQEQGPGANRRRKYRFFMALSDEEPMPVCCVKEKLEKRGKIDNLETATLVLRFCLRFFQDQWTKSCAFELLPKLDESFGPAHLETVTFVQYLAESLVFNDMFCYGLPGGITSKERSPILERHLRHLEEQEKPDVSLLCFWYDLARQRLGSQIEEEASLARHLIERAFVARVECFGESHAESDAFISELLDDFCAKESDKYNLPSAKSQSPYCGQDPHNIISDLLSHCYKTDRLAEAEVLVRECLAREGVLEATGSRSGLLRFHEGTPQFTVASHNAPGTFIYWEDSRTYLRRWTHVTLEPTSPAEFFPAFPVQLTVEPDRIDITMSKASHDDLASLLGLASEEDILKEIRGLTTWSCLELMQTRGLLRDLLFKYAKRKYLFLDHKRTKISTPVEDYLTSSEECRVWPSTIWLFPELHFTAELLERAVSLLVTFNFDLARRRGKPLTYSLVGIRNGSFRPRRGSSTSILRRTSLAALRHWALHALYAAKHPCPKRNTRSWVR